MTGIRALRVPPREARVLPLSDSYLEGLLAKFVAPKTSSLTSSYCLHLLRVHGPTFRLEGSSRSRALLDVFIDSDASLEVFESPLMTPVASGVRYPVSAPRGRRSYAVAAHDLRADETHCDQTLAAFAELGLPLGHLIRVGEKEYCVGDVLRDSQYLFDIHQRELEWTLIAYSLYLPFTKEWQNRHGESCNLESVVKECLARPLSDASCAGVHRAFAVTVALRAHDLSPFLSEEVSGRARQWLRGLVAAAVGAQQPDGSWTLDWNESSQSRARRQLPSAGRVRKECLLATGHLTEWLLYLPPQLQPPSDTLRRSGLWLMGELDSASPADIESRLCHYTHSMSAVRLLANTSVSQ